MLGDRATQSLRGQGQTPRLTTRGTAFLLFAGCIGLRATCALVSGKGCEGQFPRPPTILEGFRYSRRCEKRQLGLILVWCTSHRCLPSPLDAGLWRPLRSQFVPAVTSDFLPFAPALIQAWFPCTYVKLLANGPTLSLTPTLTVEQYSGSSSAHFSAEHRVGMLAATLAGSMHGSARDAARGLLLECQSEGPGGRPLSPTTVTT